MLPRSAFAAVKAAHIGATPNCLKFGLIEADERGHHFRSLAQPDVTLRIPSPLDAPETITL
jgi:hypothetical protein